MSKSSYLKRAEMGRGKLLTIRDCVQETIKGSDGPEEKWILYFIEEEKGMVCNPTNAALIAQICGERNSDNWGEMGVKIVAYDEPNVSMGGKLVGGIRVRAPKGQAAKPLPKPAQAQAPVESEPGEGEEDDSDLPF